MPERTFSFTCPHCEKENIVKKTSNLWEIPEYSDEPKEFYVTCTHCFDIFRIEYVVVICDVLDSSG